MNLLKPSIAKEFLVVGLISLCYMCVIGDERERAEMYGAKASIEVQVTNEEGETVSNALVKIYFGMSVREGKEVKGKTNAGGVFEGQGKTTGEIYIDVEHAGFYNSTRHLRLFDETSAEVKKGKWQPYGRKEKIVLRRIGIPVSLLRYGKTIPIPETNTWFGFDMEVKDFVAPNGKGVTADFDVQIQWDGLPPTSSLFDSVAIRFRDKGSGAYQVQRCDESDFKWVHQANVDGYSQTELHFSKRRVVGGYEKFGFDEKRPVVCRTRCRFDADGNMIAANYSLITRLGSGSSWQGKALFVFSCFFNPTVNDRNLEEQNIYNTQNFRTIGGFK